MTDHRLPWRVSDEGRLLIVDADEHVVADLGLVDPGGRLVFARANAQLIVDAVNGLGPQDFW